jgi:hypothetical protein
METTNQPSPNRPPIQPSRRADNPWRQINLRTERGRRIRVLAERLLYGIPNGDDPLVLGSIISTAELMIICADLRSRPLANASDTATLVRLEGLVDRRVRRLSFARRSTTPAPSSFSMTELGG